MSSSPELLVHLASEQEWSAARNDGWIAPKSAGPEVEAFVHLSTVEQVHLPANRLYHGRRDMVLLYVEVSALGSPVRWESGVPTDPVSMQFPHLYGPLPVRAVVKVIAYPPAPDGNFSPLVGGRG